MLFLLRRGTRLLPPSARPSSVIPLMAFDGADGRNVPREDTGSSSSSTSLFLSGSEDGRGRSSSGEVPVAMVSECWTAAFPAGGVAPKQPESRRTRCIGWSKGGAVTWGAASMVGRRREMEDAVAVMPELLESTCEGVGGCRGQGGAAGSHVRFFGVYDGHGGSQVANYCAQRIHKVVADEWQRGHSEQGWQRRWEIALSDAFQRVDNELVTEAVASDAVGSTAVTVMISGCQIISSNCGDSRAILCRGNQTIQLTVDHKPDREDERARIEAGGGYVINWKGTRVLGILALSRSIGDRCMRPWVIPVPEVSFTARTEEDECIVLASDGLWDVMTNEAVGAVACQLLRRRRRSGVVGMIPVPPAQVVANRLLKLAFQRNSSDNITIIIVDLQSEGRQHVCEDGM